MHFMKITGKNCWSIEKEFNNRRIVIIKRRRKSNKNFKMFLTLMLLKAMRFRRVK